MVYAPVLLSVVVLLPLSVGIGVLRHDLFDVDRLLSESASWAVTLLVSAAASKVAPRCDAWLA